MNIFKCIALSVMIAFLIACPSILDPKKSSLRTNSAPVVNNMITNQTRLFGFRPFMINLDSIFSGVDGNMLLYYSVSNDSAVVAASISNDILTISEGANIGTATITVSANNDRGGSVSEAFDITVIEGVAVYGYRLTVTNSNEEIPNRYALQLAEGGIHDGNSSVDLLAGVLPTGHSANFGTLNNFNDENESQENSAVYYTTTSNSNNKRSVEVLGTNKLAVRNSVVFRVRIVASGISFDRTKMNHIVVSLLDANGLPIIGSQSNPTTGFSNDDSHDGFIVEFSAVDGSVTQQPMIFSF